MKEKIFIFILVFFFPACPTMAQVTVAIENPKLKRGRAWKCTTWKFCLFSLGNFLFFFRERIQREIFHRCESKLTETHWGNENLGKFCTKMHSCNSDSIFLCSCTTWAAKLNSTFRLGDGRENKIWGRALWCRRQYFYAFCFFFFFFGASHITTTTNALHPFTNRHHPFFHS